MGESPSFLIPTPQRKKPMNPSRKRLLIDLVAILILLLISMIENPSPVIVRTTGLTLVFLMGYNAFDAYQEYRVRSASQSAVRDAQKRYFGSRDI